MNRITIPLCLCLALTVIEAGEGRIPIYQGTTVTTPGHYVLTRDLDPGAVNINSSDVTLDLNGWTLRGPVNLGAGVQRVVVRNGRIAGGGVSHTSGAVGAGVRVESVHFSGTGVVIDPAGQVDVIDCVFETDDEHAVDIVWLPTSGAGRFVRNRIIAPERLGLFLTGMVGGEVRDNVISDYNTVGHVFGYGILISGPGGNIIEGNVINGGTGDALSILGSDNNMVLRNSIRGASTRGVHLDGDGNKLVGNGVADCVGHGIEVEGNRNLIEDNHVEGNTGCAVSFANANDHAYRNNMLRGNTGGSTCGSANTDAGGNLF